jgi:membrane protease YdiL (CAAX protease family)
MRGYLIARFERLLRSTWLAVLITTVMFGSYHLYQGVGPAIVIAASGLVYAAAFCWFRRLWPLCVAHALADFIALAW